MRSRGEKELAAKVAPILDEAARAYEDGELERVLELSQQALRIWPNSAEAWHYDAATHRELGELQAADEAYRKAIELAPDDAEILAGAAELLVSAFGEERESLEEALRLCRRGLKLAQKAGDRELQLEFLLLQGTALNQAGEALAALHSLDEAMRIDPAALDVRLEHAYALFELCRFDAARTELEAIVRDHPDEAWAHHHLGLIAERAGEPRRAEKHFERARQLSREAGSDEFPEPVTFTEAEFDRAVEDAVKQLPEPVKKYLDNTTIAVEAIPSDEDLVSSNPPLSPTILGIFRGTPVGERSVTNAFDHVTASIVLYQRNLERFARTRDELIEQIGITLMHEVGHLIGLDEDDLWERGLD